MGSTAILSNQGRLHKAKVVSKYLFSNVSAVAILSNQGRLHKGDYGLLCNSYYAYVVYSRNPF